MSNHFPSVEPRAAEQLEQEARRLADALRPRCQRVDNFAMQSANVLATRWGPLSFILQTRAAESHAVGAVVVKETVPYRYLLMGVQAPRSSVEELARFPLILKRVALLLGARDDSTLTRFDNDIKYEADDLGKGEAAAAGGDKGEAAAAKAGAQAKKADAGQISKGELLRGALARSITFSWPAETR